MDQPTTVPPTPSAEGLTVEEAELRLKRDGPNELETAAPISPWKILLSQFANLMVVILIVAAVVALAGWYLDGAQGLPGDAITIATIVVLNAMLGFAQEYRAERTLQELKRTTTARAQVIRSGQARSVERSDLVVGDLVMIAEGDRVPADLRLVEAQRLQVDESLLTGESEVVHKAVAGDDAGEGAGEGEASADLFAGTVVTAGRGLGVVSATGSRTQLGGIATSMMLSHPEETPLERRLNRLGSQIGWGVLIVSAIVGLTLLVAEGAHDVRSLVHILIFAVALAVAAVPEGLPAVLTVSLSIGARRLARRNAVVRRMAAVETLGSVTAIVTDKTGTLTHNQMTVRRVYVGGGFLEVSGQGYANTGKIAGRAAGLDWLIDAGVLANSAELEDSKEGRRALGDPTDAAFLVLAEKAGRSWQEARLESPQLAEVPFSSQRRRCSSLRRYRDQLQLFVKGSLDRLLPRSSAWRLGDRDVPLDESLRRELLEAEAAFSRQALRTLAVGVRRLDSVPEGDLEPLEEGFTILGLVGMGDPPREEAPEAIQRCRQAGIQVFMLTGDHPETAASVGRQVGLESQHVTTGAEVGKLDDAKLDEALRTTHIFARMSPQSKLRVVERLLARGEVVAMTGDGVNDAPALKKVHVGVAMGKSGTAVAVEASDLVLLDDNFSTVVMAIQEGRGVYTNVQKFISFLFSGNTGVVLAMFIGTILAGIFDLRVGVQLLLPLTAAQILWMNLVTDGAPAVAFSLSRSDAEVMNAPPRNPDSPILGRSLWRYVLLTGSVIAVMLLGVLDAGYHGGWFTLEAFSYAHARTMGFYTVVTTRLFNALNFRHLPQSLFSGGFFRDFYVPAACLLSWLMTLAVIQHPLGEQVFQLTPLDWRSVAILTGFSALILVPGEILKRIAPVQMTT